MEGAETPRASREARRGNDRRGPPPGFSPDKWHSTFLPDLSEPLVPSPVNPVSPLWPEYLLSPGTMLGGEMAGRRQEPWTS